MFSVLNNVVSVVEIFRILAYYYYYKKALFIYLGTRLSIQKKSNNTSLISSTLATRKHVSDF